MTIKSKLPGKSAGGSSAGNSTSNSAEFVSGHQKIENLARIAQIIEDNPDLFASFIEDILVALAEAKAGHKSEYEFDLPE